MKTARARAAELVPAVVCGGLLLIGGGVPSQTALPFVILLVVAGLGFAIARARLADGSSSTLDIVIALGIVWFAVSAWLSPAPGSSMARAAAPMAGALTFLVALQLYRNPGSIRRGFLYVLVIALFVAILRPLFNANHNGAVLAAVLPVAVVLAVWKRNRYPGWIRPAALVVAAACAAALVVTGSRGAMGAVITTGAIAAVVALLYRRSRRWIGPASVAVLSGAILLMAADPIALELSTEQLELSTTERLDLWRTGLAAFLERPLTGWGPGNFAPAFAAHRTADVPFAVAFAHQELVQWLVEGGLPALALLGTGVFLLARELSFGLHRSKPLRPLVLGAAAALLTIAIHAQVDFAHHLPGVAALVGWIAGLGVMAARIEAAGLREYLPEPPGTLARRWRPVALALLCAVPATALLWIPDRSVELAQTGRDRYAAAHELGNPGLLIDAENALVRSTLLNPLRAGVWADLGRVRSDLSDSTGSLAAFERAVAADPAHPVWRRAYARALLQNGSDEAAAREYASSLDAHSGLFSEIADEILTLRGRDLDLLCAATPGQWKATGAHLAARGFYGDALDVYQRALAVTPTDVDLVLRVSRLARRFDDLELARGVLAPLAEEPRILAELGHLAAADGELDRAVQMWERAAAVEPGNPSPHIALSSLATRRGDRRAALQSARDARNAAPCDRAAVQNLVRVYEANKLLSAATRELEMAAERCHEPAYLTDLDAHRARWR